MGSWKVIRNRNSWCARCRPFFIQSIKGNDKQNIELLAKKSFQGYRHYDRKKGLVFDLSIEDVIKAKSSPCVYCNRLSSGFDRIDNSLGHTRENCVPACVRCNWVRGSYLSYEVMLKVGQVLQKEDL